MIVFCQLFLRFRILALFRLTIRYTTISEFTNQQNIYFCKTQCQAPFVIWINIPLSSILYVNIFQQRVRLTWFSCYNQFSIEWHAANSFTKHLLIEIYLNIVHLQTILVSEQQKISKISAKHQNFKLSKGISKYNLQYNDYCQINSFSAFNNLSPLMLSCIYL